MTPTDVLVVGEALVDVVHRTDGSVDERPGGSSANVALALGRLDRRPRLLTSLGDDARGRLVRAWLQASGVVIEGATAARTSTASAHLDEHGAASYEFAIDWDVDTSAAGRPDALHLGSIAAVLDPGAETVSRLADRHHGRALITYDPNIRPSVARNAAAVRDRVGSLIARADVVKASDEDIAWLNPGEDPAEVARAWARSGPGMVVVTLGADGAFAVAGSRDYRIPGVPVEVVDTVGAGDTFMGALIDGLLDAGVHGASAHRLLGDLGTARITALLRRCVRAAAVTVSRPGTDPPTRADLAEQRSLAGSGMMSGRPWWLT